MSTHTIGEVLGRLKSEFEDITISKIRFLETEGLISPDRTDSGYRKFSEQDIDRLRYVLRAQRDRYLPLKVIREELDRVDAGLPVEQAEVGAAASAPTADEALLDADADVRLTAEQVADAAGIDPRTVFALRDAGVVDQPPYDGVDLVAVRAAAGLLDRGLEPRHLRMFGQFVGREIALFEQVVAPQLRARDAGARRDGEHRLGELVDGALRLHHTLLERERRRLPRS